MWFVYIVRCADAALYIGETADVEKRVARHNAGIGCGFTSGRTPVALAYTEALPDRPTALARERQLKRWSRAKKDALITRDFALLKRL